MHHSGGLGEALALCQRAYVAYTKLILSSEFSRILYSKESIALLNS